ncbi:hypothetical protein ACN3XK_24120 [Actinomadura welshii]
MGVENDTKTDTRADTSDKPTAQERPSTPPPDNPGSPGQPSRLESRARAREAQQANGSQQTDAKNTGGPPREQRDDKPASTHGSAATKPEATAKAQDTGNDERRPEGRETERPAARDQQYGPPPDNPGSPGQPSRLESLARAREAQLANASQRPEDDNGRPEPGSGERATKPLARTHEGGGGEPQPAADRDRDVGEAESPHERGGRRDHAAAADAEPRTDDRQAEQAAEQRTDARGETTDEPASSERRYALPADNPGSPGQPSRLESLARAREHQESRSQESDVTGTGSGPLPESDTRPASDQSMSNGANTEAAGTPGVNDSERDAGRPRSGETTRRDEQGAEAHPQAGQTSENARQGEGEREPLPQHDDPKPDTSNGPPAPESTPQGADRPAGDSRERRPEPTGETTDQPSGPHEAASGGPEIQERTADLPQDSDASQTPGGRAEDGHRSGPESAEHPQSEPENRPDTERPAAASDASEGDEPRDHRITDDTRSSPEEADHGRGTREPHEEQDSDNGKDAGESGTTAPEGNTRSGFTPYNIESGRTYTVPLSEITESSDNSAQPLQVEEADTERSPYAVSLDDFTRASLDPTGANDEPNVAAKAPDREETPESAPESRIERARRATWMRGADLKDAGTALSDTANGILGPRPPTPTGHAETATGPYTSPPDSQGATPDAFVAAATVAMLAVEGTRKAKQVGSQVVDRIRGRDHDGNR